MYSSIEMEERINVINKCYWPIFKLADIGISIGIEAPALYAVAAEVGILEKYQIGSPTFLH